MGYPYFFFGAAGVGVGPATKPGALGTISIGASGVGPKLALAILSTLAVLNLLRSPTGRAFVAIRDRYQVAVGNDADADRHRGRMVRSANRRMACA